MYYLMMFLLISSFAQCMDAPFKMTVAYVDRLFKKPNACSRIKSMLTRDRIDPNEIFSKNYGCVSADITIGHVALYNDRMDIFGLVLETGKVNQDTKDKLLYHAAIGCKVDFMELLLKHKANPNNKNSNLYKALPLCCLLHTYRSLCNAKDTEPYRTSAQNHFNAITILVKDGTAQFHIKGELGFSAYDYAKQSNDVRIKELFNLP